MKINETALNNLQKYFTSFYGNDASITNYLNASVADLFLHLDEINRTSTQDIFDFSLKNSISEIEKFIDAPLYSGTPNTTEFNSILQKKSNFPNPATFHLYHLITQSVKLTTATSKYCNEDGISSNFLFHLSNESKRINHKELNLIKTHIYANYGETSKEFESGSDFSIIMGNKNGENTQTKTIWLQAKIGNIDESTHRISFNYERENNSTKIQQIDRLSSMTHKKASLPLYIVYRHNIDFMPCIDVSNIAIDSTFKQTIVQNINSNGTAENGNFSRLQERMTAFFSDFSDGFQNLCELGNFLCESNLKNKLGLLVISDDDQTAQIIVEFIEIVLQKKNKHIKRLADSIRNDILEIIEIEFNKKSIEDLKDYKDKDDKKVERAKELITSYKNAPIDAINTITKKTNLHKKIIENTMEIINNHQNNLPRKHGTNADTIFLDEQLTANHDMEKDNSFKFSK